ncbi:helix-turn-helix domain-containing protein [Nostoc sp.]
MIAQIEDVKTHSCCGIGAKVSTGENPRGAFRGCHSKPRDNEMLPLMHPREFLSQFPLTYKELAERLGVTVYAVDNWMGNRKKPSRQTLRQVADFAARLQENSIFRKLVLATEADE